MNVDNPTRDDWSAQDIVQEIWTHLQLPWEALDALTLEGDGHILPTSFHVDRLAQATIALSALSASLVQVSQDSSKAISEVQKVRVPLHHAVVEFASERLYTLDGGGTPNHWGPLSGLYECKDGHVRIHDNAEHHRFAALKVLGLKEDATREQVESRVLTWNAVELEEEAARRGAIIYVLRSYAEWYQHPQSRHVPDMPVCVSKIGDGPSVKKKISGLVESRGCLAGLKVIEMTRVIAGPVAGRTLAVHGADVVWIENPCIEALSSTDIDVHRGKCRVCLDLNVQSDKDQLLGMIKSADVFLQSYRPGSLAARGLGPADLVKTNPRIIYASLTAWGTQGPWRHNRGFDSIVQTVSGMNVSEGRHWSIGGRTLSRALPIQCLDHAAGYLLVTGICAARYKQIRGGGAWQVDVSLAGVMKYLCSLGQIRLHDGWKGDGVKDVKDLFTDEMSEIVETEHGQLRAVRHSAMMGNETMGK